MTERPAELEQFAKQARAFIAWCEALHADKSKHVIHLECLQQLSDVYASALRLPSADVPAAPEPPLMREEKREALSLNLAALPFRYYWEVFTPSDMEGDKEPVCGDLRDDFLDIYGDLAKGLWLYERDHVEAAAFSWSFAFQIHWGRHVVSALHALHSFRIDEGDADRIDP